MAGRVQLEIHDGSVAEHLRHPGRGKRGVEVKEVRDQLRYEAVGAA